MAYLGGGAIEQDEFTSPAAEELRPRVKDSGAGASFCRVHSTPVLGGSMRIGNRLGGVLVWALAATMSVAAGAQTAERVTTVPLGGSLDGQSGDRYFGVYVPTRFGGELTIKATSGQVVGLKGPDGAASDQRPGRRRGPAGMVHLQGAGGRRSPTRWRRRSSRSARASSGPGTSITGRRRPTRSTSRGPAATAGSTR